MKTATNLKETFKHLVGVKFDNKILLSILNRSDRPYRIEVDEEIDGIYESDRSSKGRSYAAIATACESGKIAEIILRESPVGAPLLEKATKKYHDLYFPADKCFVEIKRWKKNSIPLNVEKFVRQDAKNYNTSKWLFVFTYDDNFTWLDQIVEVKQAILNEVVEVHLARNSYTIYLPTYRHLKSVNGDICFINAAGKRFYRTFDWFDSMKRESNSGIENGGYYVFASAV